MHLRLLQVEAGLGEFMEVANVIIVHVGEDHILDPGGVAAQQSEGIDGVSLQLAAALAAAFGGEADIDDDLAVCVLGEPDEVVHRHRTVMRVAADEVLMPPGGAVGVFQGEEFVGIGHCSS